MSEHFHYIEDMSLARLNLGEKTVVSQQNTSGNSVKGTNPATDSKPREIEIGIVNRKPLYIVFRLDKLKLWGVSDE